MSLGLLDLLLNVLLLASSAGWLALMRRQRLAVWSIAVVWVISSVSLVGLAALMVGGPFAVMRSTAWWIFVHLPIALLVAGWVSRSRALLAAPAVLSAAALAAIGVDAFFIEPRALEIEHFRIESAEITEEIRIVVLSDIQTDDVGDYEREAFARAAELHPDLIVMPGDFLQIPFADEARYRAEVEAFRALLPMLRAPLGIFAVEGNVDYRKSWATDLFSGTNVTASAATVTHDLGSVQLSALSFRDGFHPNVRLPSHQGFHIAFAHAPDFSLSSGVDADLLIAGHTHGGQVQLPLFGPPLTLSRVPRSAGAGGRTVLSPGRDLVVSRGIGMERDYAPRLRFLCRPQIVVIDVVPAGQG